MNRRRVTQVTLTFCLLCCSQLCAQPPRTENRDKFYDALGEAHRQLIPQRELVGLLWHKEIRDEVGLSAENYEMIEALRNKQYTAVMAIGEELRDPTLTKEERVKRIVEAQAPLDKQIYELLQNSENAKFDRLLGLYVQSRGFSAATNEIVAERIGLEGDAFIEYRRARGETWHQLMDENRDKMSNLIREGDRQKISRLFEEADKKLNVALASKLSSEQRAALLKLQGEKFDLPKQPDFRGPRGRRGNGRRGNGDRGPPPGGPPERQKPSKECVAKECVAKECLGKDYEVKGFDD